MREITPDNAADYLCQTGALSEPILGVEALGWGVSNLVLRIRTPKCWYILKQSRPQLRTRELWFSDPERIFREAEAMQALGTIVPNGVVPRVLQVNRADYWVLMEHAPPQAVVWKGELLAGRIDAAVGKFAGLLLGTLHRQTHNQPDWRQRFLDRTIFWQLRTEPFYHRILSRHPDIADAVRPLIHRLDTHSEAICHGDFSPKNFLVWPDRSDGFFTLVDYETVHFGDPAMDVGFFLCHLLLKALRWARPIGRPGDQMDAESSSYSTDANVSRAEQMLALTEHFWASYRRSAGDLCTPQHEFWARLHCGVVMLVRIDGTSPVDYLPEETMRAAARELAKSLLLQPAEDWHEVLARSRQACRQLASRASP